MKHQLTLLLFLWATFTHAQTLLTDYWNNLHPDWWLTYNDIRPIDKNVAVVQQGRMFGLVDITGKELLPPRYTSINRFGQTAYCMVSSYGLQGVCNQEGKIIVPVRFDNVIVGTGKLYGIDSKNIITAYSSEGKELSLPALQLLHIYQVEADGYFVGSRDGVFRGVVDSTGRWLIEPKYTYLYHLQDGYYYASLGGMARLVNPGKQWEGKAWYDEVRYPSKNGFWARKQGNFQPFRFYDWGDNPVNNMPGVEKFDFAGINYKIAFIHKKFSLLDSDNNTVLAGYEEMGNFSMINGATLENPFPPAEQLFQIGPRGSKGIFDGKKWLIPEGFNYFVSSHGKIIGIGTDSSVVYDKKGNVLEVLPIPYAFFAGDCWLYSQNRPDSVWHITRGWIKTPKGSVQIHHSNSQTLDILDKQHLYGLMSQDGQILVSGCDGPSIYYHKGPYWVYKKLGRKGWIAKDTSFSTPPVYDEVIPLQHGNFLVEKDFRWGIVDRSGKELLPFVKDDYKMSGTGSIVALKQNSLWRPYYSLGQPIGEPEFAEIEDNYNDVFWGKTSRGWVLYSSTGKVLSPYPADEPPLINFDHYLLKHNGKYGKVSIDGEVLIPFEWDSLVINYDSNFGIKGNTVTIFDAGITVPGKEVYPLGKIGYTVGTPGNWSTYYKNGKPFISEQLLSLPLGINNQPAFWAQTGLKTWKKVDYFGTIEATIAADSITWYDDAQQFIRVKNGAESYIINTISGQKWPQQFDKISQISNSRYISYSKGKSGIVDDQFNEIIPCLYDEIALGKAYYSVKSGDKSALLDLNGKVCIPLDQYESPWYFSNIGDDLISARKKGLIGYYSTSLHQWFPPTLQDLRNCQVRIPLAKQLYIFKTNGLYGIMDEDCKEVLAPQYEGIQGVGNVVLLANNKGTSLFDPVKKVMIAEDFSNIRPFHEYLLCQKGSAYKMFLNDQLIFTKEACLIDGGGKDLLLFTDLSTRKTGLLNMEGQLILNAEYDELNPARIGTYYAQKNGKYGLVNIKGNVLVPFEFTGYQHTGSIDFAIFRKGPLNGLYDMNGKQLLPPVYSKILLPETFDYNSPVYFITQKDGKYQYFNREGQPLIPGAWDEVGPVKFGLAAVKNGDKWGYVNLNGEMVIPFQYRYAGEFTPKDQTRMATVIKDRHYQTIDPTGKVIADRLIGSGYASSLAPPIETFMAYKEIPFYGGEYTLKGYYYVSDLKTNKMGLVNLLGEYVIKPQYDELSALDYGKDAIARMRKGQLWGLINYNGEVMLEPAYDELTPPSYDKPGLYRVRKGGESFIINEKGEKQ